MFYYNLNKIINKIAAVLTHNLNITSTHYITEQLTTASSQAEDPASEYEFVMLLVLQLTLYFGFKLVWDVASLDEKQRQLILRTSSVTI